jgi:hypothetical protein
MVGFINYFLFTLSLLLIVFAVFLVSACSSEPEPTAVNDELGNWGYLGLRGTIIVE